MGVLLLLAAASLLPSHGTHKLSDYVTPPGNAWVEDGAYSGPWRDSNGSLVFGASDAYQGAYVLKAPDGSVIGFAEIGVARFKDAATAPRVFAAAIDTNAGTLITSGSTKIGSPKQPNVQVFSDQTSNGQEADTAYFVLDGLFCQVYMLNETPAMTTLLAESEVLQIDQVDG